MTTSNIISTVVQALFIPLLLYAVTIARNYLVAEIKDLRIKRILDQATDAAYLAVQTVGQTYVDSIKGTDEWNKEAQRKAFELALAKTKEILSAESLKILESATSDVNVYLTAAIEAAVREAK